MPVYEFQCKKCSEVFEVKCRVEEYSKLKPTCPKCKSEEVERKISTFYAQTESKT
ncbi:MAG: zinc ribbon domain-containing protein [Candidatus Omnitrophica bacterium]|nr:zinc ribbon domain-containing protein [Candidatus Omnitrophota bacterium]MCM8798581.1 zinc ribbon domain-containing protein [Candidatus Omnitrophota bacterium]